MIRAVLAVILTVALIGVSLPAIDDARHDHADSIVRGEVDQFEQAATNLLDEDDPTAGEAGARRFVTLSVPTRSWTDARVDTVAIAASPNGSGGKVSWTFDRGTEQVRWLPDVPIRTPAGDALVLESAGNHQLVLSLDGTRERPVVTVQQFTNHDGTSPAHATAAADGS